MRQKQGNVKPRNHRIISPCCASRARNPSTFSVCSLAEKNFFGANRLFAPRYALSTSKKRPPPNTADYTAGLRILAAGRKALLDCRFYTALLGTHRFSADFSTQLQLSLLINMLDEDKSEFVSGHGHRSVEGAAWDVLRAGTLSFGESRQRYRAPIMVNRESDHSRLEEAAWDGREGVLRSLNTTSTAFSNVNGDDASACPPRSPFHPFHLCYLET
jgi:hypothetical protein